MSKISEPMIATPSDVYNLIKEGSKLSDKFAYTHPFKTNGRSVLTSLGRIWINIILPEDYPLISETMTKKKLQQLVIDMYKKYGVDVSAEYLTKLQSEAFKLASVSPNSFNIEDFIPPADWLKKKNEFLKVADKLNPMEFKKEAEKLNVELLAILKETGYRINNILDFSPKGNPVGDWMLLLVARGYVIDIEGKLLGPITKSLNDGYGKVDYYNAASEARSNFYSRSSLTAHPGYLTTKTTMANASTQIGEKNCGSKKYFSISVNDDIAKLIQQRYYIDEDVKLKKIDSLDEVIGKTIKLRSPLYCKSEEGICEICYGDLHKKLNTKNVGILAGGAVNVVGINAMMKMRHKPSSMSTVEVDFPALIKKSGVDLADLKPYFDIRKNEIIAKVSCTISIDQDEYDDISLIDSGDKFQIPGILTVQIGEIPHLSFVTLPIGIVVDLIKPTDYQSEGHIITMNYEPGEVIMKQDYYSDNFNERVMMRLFEGGAKYITNPETLVMTMHDKLPGIDLCHIELIVSNMFRDADDTTKPARLSGYKHVEIMGQKKLPFATSWLNALAFENINRAIKVGLMEGKDAKLDPIEKIVIESYYDI